MKKISRDRAAALAVAEHAYAIKRAREMTDDETEQQALIRLGPVPAQCPCCHQRPPTVYAMTSPGGWMCRVCAGLEGGAQ